MRARWARLKAEGQTWWVNRRTDRGKKHRYPKTRVPVTLATREKLRLKSLVTHKKKTPAQKEKERQDAITRWESLPIEQKKNRMALGKKHGKDWWVTRSEEEKDVIRKRGAESWRFIQKPTSIERKVYAWMKEEGIEFEAEYPIKQPKGNYFADCYVPSLNLVIECDGERFHGDIHFPGQKARDAKRDAWMRDQGYSVLRLSEKDINSGKAKAILLKSLRTTTT